MCHHCVGMGMTDACMAAQGVKLTLLPFFVKALSLALAQHPAANASLDTSGQAPSGASSTAELALRLHAAHNIGVAMATPNGLVVPNIKNVSACPTCSCTCQLYLPAAPPTAPPCACMDARMPLQPSREREGLGWAARPRICCR